MNKNLWLIILILLFPLLAWSGGLRKPSRMPSESSPEQKATLREGIALHDQGDYDGAIKKYETVLHANPDCVSALYEMGFSYFAKKDYKKSLEISEKGITYISDLLAQFYMQMGNCLDHLGESEKAIDVYKLTIKEFPNEHLLHFNLALTYSNQKKPEAAIEQLKEELYLTPEHATSHFLLGSLFQENGFKIPAIFAFSRFLILEPHSSRSSKALKSLEQLINSGVEAKDEKNINIFIDAKSKKEEGDFESLQMALSLVSAGRFLEKNQEKKPIDQEVEQFRSFFQIMLEMIGEKKNKLRFTGDYYVPYFIQLQKQGHTDAFVYLIHTSSEDQNVRTWLEHNLEKSAALLEWSKQYQWSRKKG